MFRRIGRGLRAVSKKVWVTLAFLTVFFAVGATWIGVANAMAQFKPVGWYGLETFEQRATVSGNGGPAVMVGNWLYFVGNFVETRDIRYRQNEHNRVEYGGIYRVYIPDGKGPVYDDALDANGHLNANPHLLNQDRFDLVVPKIAGFDRAALWIFDKHLIYTSPNNERDRFGNLQLGRLDFFRVDLDGNNHRKLYTTTENGIGLDEFTVASIDGNVFILVKDGNVFQRINVTDRPGRVTTISEDVTGDVALPVVTSYRTVYGPDPEDVPITVRSLANSYSGIMRYAFFTEGLADDDEEVKLGPGNRVFQYDILNDEKVEARIVGHNISLLGLSNGRLVYTVRDENWESLGLFATAQVISDTITDPFDISRKADRPRPGKPGEFETPRYINDFTLLEKTYWDSGDQVYFRTVHTPTSTFFRFAVLNGSRLDIFRSGPQTADGFPLGIGPQSPIAYVTGVGSIITIDGDTVHYVDSGGNFGAVNLAITVPNDTLPVGLLSRPLEQFMRPWVVTRAIRGISDEIWHFHIRSYTADSECTENHDHSEHDHLSDEFTIAMLADVFTNPALPSREFILGRLECRFLGHSEDDC